jgi:DNA-binding transcriptional regulator YiaG
MSRMPTKTTKTPSRLTRALLETARDMKDAGVLTEPAYEKITLRHLSKGEVSEVEPITGQDIRTLREQAHMSQADSYSVVQAWRGARSTRQARRRIATRRDRPASGSRAVSVSREFSNSPRRRIRRKHWRGHDARSRAPQL